MSELPESNTDRTASPRLARLSRRLPSLRSLMLLWLPALLAAGVVLLPVFYLVLRAAGAPNGIWENILQLDTLATMARTLWLALAVTALSAAIAVPIAWLTVRTDLPGRYFWTVVTPLPLVIPSYVGAYLMVSTIGPKGLFQGWLEGLTGLERLPEIYGFPGAALILTLLSYPFILLSTRAALLSMSPELEEAARSLGKNTWQTFWRVIFP
ncbi:MAG: ABC transporter permease subunit, partial [Anaerolineae bacterium]|nr:ABC transporter permease subunit [Anaerolineae bacterium]